MTQLPIVIAKSVLTQQLQMCYDDNFEQSRTQAIYYLWQECVCDLGYHFNSSILGPWSTDLNSELKANNEFYEYLDVRDVVIAEKALDGFSFFRTLQNPSEDNDTNNQLWLRLLANLLSFYHSKARQGNVSHTKARFIREFVDSSSLAHRYKDVLDIAFEQLKPAGVLPEFLTQAA